MVRVAGFPTPEYNKPGLICALHTDGESYLLWQFLVER